VTAGGLRVRRGGIEDVDAVLALERQVAEAPHWTRESYASIVGNFVPAGDACAGYHEAAGGEQDGAGRVRRALFVVEESGDLLGFSVGSVWGGELIVTAVGKERNPLWGELETVVVAQAERRRGAGRALCLAVVEWCRVEGAERVDLEVRAGSGGAVTLYEDLGFGVTGHRRGYYSDPVEDALLMALRVRGADVDGGPPSPDAR